MASSILDCVLDAAQAGRISKEQAAEIQKTATDLADLGTQNLNKAVMDDAYIALALKKRQAALQVTRDAANIEIVKNHPKGTHRGLQGILARDVTVQSRNSNIDQRNAAVMRSFTMKLGKAIDDLRAKNLGFSQDMVLGRNMVRELFGESTGNANAAKAAKAFAEVFEDARVRFNEAGGSIAKLIGWGMPQGHNTRAVRAVTADVWKDFIRPLLDRARMVNGQGRLLTDMEFEYALDAAYTTISTDGMNKITPGVIGGKKLANRHSDHRFFVFKDANSWLEYQGKFGNDNPFLAAMTHLENMAGDIAQLEILGPNPAHSYRKLRDIAEQGGAGDFDLGMADAIYAVATGNWKAGHGISIEAAERLEAARNFLTSAKLGSAMLSAVSDLAFFQQTARWNGLSSTRAMGTYLKLLNPANSADRLRAVQLGLTAEAWTTLALHANRYSEVTGSGLSARAADLTVRVSGLSAHTDAASKAIGWEFLGTLAGLRKNAWDDLPTENRNSLELGGFTARDWEVLRTTKVDAHEGMEQVFLPNLAARTDLPAAEIQRVQNLVLETIDEITKAAIPMPDARTRAITSGGFSRTSIEGTAMRSGMQFKSFPVAVILSHLYRGLNQASTGKKAAYMAELVVATTVMGALALQLKEIARGREPRNMNDSTFWAAAFTQGGGAGIFGDFFYTGVFGSNRFGSSLATTFSGPLVGLASDAVKMTAGQLGQAIEGDDMSLPGDMVRTMKSYTPVVGSLWYARLAYERLVLDQLALKFDNKARQRMKTQENNRRRNYEQEFYWRPGKLTPED